MAIEAQTLKALQTELEGALEERLTELMTQVKASQALTAQISAAHQEIRRHERAHEQLTAELANKGTGVEADKMRKRAEQVQENLRKMRKQRDGLIEQMQTLVAQTRSATGR
jgi:uncharacterized coiled-coil DUF342 family protein